MRAGSEIKTPGLTLTMLAPNKPIAWELSTIEESQLESLCTETMKTNGTKAPQAPHLRERTYEFMDRWRRTNGEI
jgi:hypothetical protein